VDARGHVVADVPKGLPEHLQTKRSRVICGKDGPSSVRHPPPPCRDHTVMAALAKSPGWERRRKGRGITRAHPSERHRPWEGGLISSLRCWIRWQVQTTQFSGAYTSSGVDNALDFEQLQRDFTVDVKTLTPEVRARIPASLRCRSRDGMCVHSPRPPSTRDRSPLCSAPVPPLSSRSESARRRCLAPMAPWRRYRGALRGVCVRGGGRRLGMGRRSRWIW